MADLRVLRHLWTEDGTRSIFASLVTHLVFHRHGSGATVRPDPGDEGLDTIVGDFGDRLRVFQAKYFCERIQESQQRQIRDSWKTCRPTVIFRGSRNGLSAFQSTSARQSCGGGRAGRSGKSRSPAVKSICQADRFRQVRGGARPQEGV